MDVGIGGHLLLLGSFRSYGPLRRSRSRSVGAIWTPQGVLPCPAEGCKRDQINEWFANHDSIGLSIIVQSSMMQPLTRRSVAAWVNDPGWDKEDLSEKYADHQSDVIRELARAEGAIIETHLRQRGAIPPWNRIGGNREGAEVVAGQGDNILEARDTARCRARPP
jgi:hypothetical protein